MQWFGIVNRARHDWDREERTRELRMILARLAGLLAGCDTEWGLCVYEPTFSARSCIALPIGVFSMAGSGYSTWIPAAERSLWYIGTS